MATLPYMQDDEATSTAQLPYMESGVTSPQPAAAGLRRPQPEAEGGFIDSVQRTAGQTVKGLGQAAADYIPGVGQDNAISEYGQSVIDANPAGVTGLRDIVEKPLTAATEATGNALTSVGGMVGLRALGQGITAASPAAGPAAPLVAAFGQGVSWLGPLAVAALPSYSSIRDKQILKDPEAQTSFKDKAIATLGASTVGLIEQRFGPQNWAMAALTKEGREQVAKMLTSTTLKGSVGKGMVRGAAVEGAEELVQNPVEQIASYDDPLSKESLEETAFGGAMGAIGGGVLGGGFGAANQSMNRAVDRGQETALSKVLPDNDVSVEGGVASILNEDGSTLSVPVGELARHLAQGGKLEELAPGYGLRQNAVGQAAPTMMSSEDAEQLRFAQEATAYNQERNRVIPDAERDFNNYNPALPTSQAQPAVAEPKPSVVGEDGVVRMPSGKETFGSERALQGFLRRNNLDPEQFEVRQQWVSPSEAVYSAVQKQEGGVNENIEGVTAEGQSATGSVVESERVGAGEISDGPGAASIGSVEGTAGLSGQDNLAGVQAALPGASADPNTSAVTDGLSESVVGDSVLPAGNNQQQQRTQIEETAKKIDGSPKYDGVQTFQDISTHLFTIQSGPARGATVAVNEPTEEAIREAVVKAQVKFGQQKTFGSERALNGWFTRNKLDKSNYDITENGAGIKVLPKIMPENVITQNSGRPFATERALTGALNRQKLNPEDYTFQQVEGGIVAVPKQGGRYSIPDEAFDSEGNYTGVKFTATMGDLLKQVNADENTTGELGRYLAQFIPASKLDIPVTVDSKAKTAQYDTKTGITINDPRRLAVSLHEIFHSVTVREMRADPKRRQEVLDLMQLVDKEIVKRGIFTKDQLVAIAKARTGREFKKRFPLGSELDKYGHIAYSMLNEKEFLAQLANSLQVQSFLKDIKIRKGGKLRQAWDVILEKVMDILGISYTQKTAFSEALRLTAELASQEVNEQGGVNEFAGQANESMKSAIDRITNLEAFKKWFGDSKVVDENGEPLVVYHGTKKVFKAFKDSLTNAGIFFSPDASKASGYAEAVRTDGASVIPVYLRIENPFIVDGKGAMWGNIKLPEAMNPDLLGDVGSPSLISSWARVNGYDGAIIKNIVDTNPGDPVTTHIAVFNPTQIKSIFNQKWDGTNPDINEALTNVADTALKQGTQRIEQALKTLVNPKSKLYDTYVAHADKWLKITPLRTLVQLYGKRLPQVKSFADHLDRVVATKTDIVTTAKEHYDQAVEIAERVQGKDALNIAAATASFNRMTPWKPLMEQDWVPKEGTASERLTIANTRWNDAGMKKATGMTFNKAYREAADAYKGLKSQKLRAAYADIVEHLTELRGRERNSLLTFIEQMSKEGSKLRKNLMEQFNNSFSTLQGAYWPLSRYGDFRMEYTDQEGFRIVKHYETLADRRADRDALVAEGIDKATMAESYKDKRPRSEVAIPLELMGQLSAEVENKYLENVDPNNAEAVEAAKVAARDVLDDMNQVFLRWQPETSAFKNSIRRGNVKGFDTDMLRSYLDYTQRHASNIAWTEEGRRVEADIQSLSEEVSKRTKGLNGVDTTLDQHIVNDLRGRIDALKTSKVGPVASTMGKLSTAYFMTSPSIALVQMSQLGVLTLPNLAVKYGMGKAVKALATHTKNAFSKDFTKKAMFDSPKIDKVFENLRATVTEQNREEARAKGKELGERLYTEEELLRQINRLSPYQKQLLALREAMARNLLDISATHEAYELTVGKNPNRMTSKIFNLAMLPMSLSELTSRKAAVLSTFDLSQQQGKNFFEAIDDVADVVNDTLYSYSKENKPALLQGGVARVVGQFQWYRIMTAVRLAQIFVSSIKGETPEVKSAARKEFIGIMGTTAMLSGAVGLPLANTMFAIMDTLLGDDDEPEDSRLLFTNWVNESFGQNLGQVITNGLPSLAGADLSRRTGLADIYGMQQDPPPWLHGQQLAAWWAASQMGPVFSVGAGWVQGYDEMVRKGNYMKGLEVATPKPIRDVLKAIRIGTEGLKTGDGKKLLSDDEIGPDEVFMLALGFNADEVSRAQGGNRSLTNLSAQITARRGKLIRNAAKAVLDGGDTTKELSAIRTFNQKMPQYAVTGADIRPAVRKLVLGERGVTGKRERQVAAQYDIPVYMK